jgi:hypothetical protein
LDLTFLSETDAAELHKHKGNLDFTKLETLSDAAAEGVAKHEGKLFFDRLNSLSGRAAESLSKHHGEIHFWGMSSLSDAAAVGFSSFKGGLYLSMLKSISDVVAEALSHHEGILDLRGLNSLSDVAAEALSRHKGPLCLSDSISLSEAAANSLFMYTGGTLPNSNQLSSVQGIEPRCLSPQNDQLQLTNDDLFHLSKELVTALSMEDFIWKAEAILFMDPTEDSDPPKSGCNLEVGYEVFGNIDHDDDYEAMMDSVLALKGKFAKVAIATGQNFVMEVTEIDVFSPEVWTGETDDPEFNVTVDFALSGRMLQVDLE